MLYGLNDICIIPEEVSVVEHRGDISIRYSDGKLPLFTAPMTSVVTEKNFQVYANNGINTIIPRSSSIEVRLDLIYTTWVAMSLSEFEEYIVMSDSFLNNRVKYVLIDIANGHMKKLLDLSKMARMRHGESIRIMAGNIANPRTVRDYAAHGIDAVRLGIGSGNACTTSANSGVHYPLGSLIAEARKEINGLKQGNDWYKSTFGSVYRIPLLIADGGMKNFDHITKALALGADYVMCGEIFAKSIEAASPVRLNNPKIYPLSKFENGWTWKDQMTEADEEVPWKKYHLCREYYGMSTKRAQNEMSKKLLTGHDLKTAEGISKFVSIEYSLEGWVENFEHYLRTTMSYCSKFNLDSFIGKVQTDIMSPSAFQAYYK